MTIKQVHADFWSSRQPQPKWISQLKPPVRYTDMIDSCVNAHAGNPEREIDKHFTAHNLLNILHLRRKRDRLLPLLNEIADSPGTTIQPTKRAAFARKWAARILRDTRAVVK